MEPIIQEILDGIDEKITKLQAAKRAILGSLNHTQPVVVTSTLPNVSRKVVIPSKVPKKSPQKRAMSAEVRKRIAEAQKKRWMEKRKAAAK